MTSHVFTYGSLMFAEVWTRVVAGAYRSTTGRLAGHRRFEVRDETYPGMVAVDDAVDDAAVDGVLYLDVDDADLARLDRFEGDDYLRMRLPIACDDGTTRDAETYVYRHRDRLLDSVWAPENFAMQRFLDTYVRDALDR